MTNNPTAEFFEDEAGEHRFRIKGGNGEVIATSEGYASHANAERGLNDLIAAAVTIGVLSAAALVGQALVDAFKDQG